MSVQVRDIEQLRRFKAAMIEFREELTAVLQMLMLEVQKTQDWVEHEQPPYWKRQVQQSFDRVSAARVALNTCLTRTVAGRRPSCIEEKQAMIAAKNRLQFCQDQVQRVRHWGIKTRHEADEFRARLSALGRLVDNHLPQAITHLEQTSRTLEIYAEVGRPATMPAPQTPSSTPHTSSPETTLNEESP